MEFKNLAEVTKLEEVPEGASVLAATAEGEVVRVPGDGLGGGGELVVFNCVMNGNEPPTVSCSALFTECLETLTTRGTSPFVVHVLDNDGVFSVKSVAYVTAVLDGGPVSDISLANAFVFQTADGLPIMIDSSNNLQVMG